MRINKPMDGSSLLKPGDFVEINGNPKKIISLKEISEWKKIPVAEIDPGYWTVAHASRNEWGVLLDNGRIWTVIFDRDLGEFDVDDDYRFWDDIICLDVGDGRIIANDGGEFGSRLYFESSDRMLFSFGDLPISSFIVIPEGIFGMGGLAHMCDGEGQIVRFSRKSGTWAAESVLEFHDECPLAWVFHQGMFRVATNLRVLDVTLGGVVTVLADNCFWRGLYPNSIVTGPDQTIYFGMRDGIVQMEKRAGGWEMFWLIDKRRDVNSLNLAAHS